MNNFKTAEDYLRNKYGAYRGSFSWRDEEKAFNAGLQSQASVIAQLEAELAEARKDQARYQWIVNDFAWGNMELDEYIYSDIRELSEFIDAAIKGQGK